MSQPPTPAECANCGAGIPRNARACPECGADERTGWRETSIYDGLDLPEEETTGASPKEHRPVSIFWMLIGIGLLALMTVTVLGLRP